METRRVPTSTLPGDAFAVVSCLASDVVLYPTSINSQNRQFLSSSLSSGTTADTCRQTSERICRDSVWRARLRRRRARVPPVGPTRAVFLFVDSIGTAVCDTASLRARESPSLLPVFGVPPEGDENPLPPPDNYATGRVLSDPRLKLSLRAPDKITAPLESQLCSGETKAGQHLSRNY